MFRFPRLSLSALFVALALVAASCGEGEDALEVESGGAETTETAETAVAETAVDDTVADGEAAPEETAAPATGAVECPPVDGAAERVVQFASPPPMCIDPAGSYQAVFTTNRGSFTVELNPALSPQTVNNFVVLARYRYYDGVSFHRIIPGFVVQGGDPVGQPVGTGGPGYTFADELNFDGYEIGSIAMANAGPNTNGSQFFVVTGENGAQLPPLYSLFGTVTEGMDVVMAIEGTGSDTGQPSEPTLMESVVIVEG